MPAALPRVALDAGMSCVEILTGEITAGALATVSESDKATKNDCPGVGLGPKIPVSPAPEVAARRVYRLLHTRR